MSVVRALPPLGHYLIQGYAQRRFADHGQWSCDDGSASHGAGGGSLVGFTKKNFGEYLYQVWASPGSGEFMFGELLHPGAIAKDPLGPERLMALKVAKISFIYGSHDWMDVGAARDCIAWAKEQRANGNKDGQALAEATVTVIDGAGHQVYLDHPRAFSEALEHICSFEK